MDLHKYWLMVFLDNNQVWLYNWHQMIYTSLDLMLMSHKVTEHTSQIINSMIQVILFWLIVL